MREKLRRVVPEGNLVSLFLLFFNRLFDPNGTGRPRFWRSVLASCLVLTIVSIAWAIREHERAGHVSTSLMNLSETCLALPKWTSFILPFICASMINFIGDFLSLWETRFVIGHMANAQGRARQAVFLLLDIVATVLIYGIFLALGAFLMFWVFFCSAQARELSLECLAGLCKITELEKFSNSSGPAGIIAGILGFVFSTFSRLIFDAGLFFSSTEPTDLFAIFFYTTFFTSVWLWAFILGIKLGSLRAWLGYKPDVDKYPVASAMLIGGVLSGLLITVVGYV